MWVSKVFVVVLFRLLLRILIGFIIVIVVIMKFVWLKIGVDSDVKFGSSMF